MTTLADLNGFVVAKVAIPATGDPADAELTLLCPATSDGSPAESFSIIGLTGIVALRNAIEDEIRKVEQATEFFADVPQ